MDSGAVQGYNVIELVTRIEIRCSQVGSHEKETYWD